MKKLNLTYSQVHAVIRAVVILIACSLAAAALFVFWWLLWVFQPLLGVPM